MERERMSGLAQRRLLAVKTGQAVPPNDCVMPGLAAGCRQCVQAAQSAVAWTLAPVVAP